MAEKEQFDPRPHLIQLKGKWYLETRYRVMWFRHDNPDGSIVTEVLSVDPPLVKAMVYNGAGQLLATGHAGADDAGKTVVWKGRNLEKSETAAVGRALANAGYGTQFSGMKDGIADSPEPVRSNQQRPTPTNIQQAARNAGGTVSKRENADAQDDLTNRDTAADFMKATRAAGIDDADVLKALGVSKLSEWTQGRKAAGQRVREWQALQSIPQPA